MKILCTGAAGFIGSHLVDTLLQQNHAVIGVDDYSAGKPENLDFARSYGGKFLEVKSDVLRLWPSLFEGVDAIYHLAASKKTVCLRNPQRDLSVNAAGTLHLLQLATEMKVKRFIHASTGSVYGEHSGPLMEFTPFRPVSFYGVSKLAGERYVNIYNGLGLDTTILRFFHVYGPRQESADEKGGVIAIFCRRLREGLPPVIYGDGTQERSFTYVGDVVRACMLMLHDDRSIGHVYNVGSGIRITVNEVAARLSAAAGYQGDFIYQDWQQGDIRQFQVCNDKLRGLDFEFKKDLETGLRDTWRWYAL